MPYFFFVFHQPFQLNETVSVIIHLCTHPLLELKSRTNPKKQFLPIRTVTVNKVCSYLENLGTSSLQKSPQIMMNSEGEALINGRNSVLMQQEYLSLIYFCHL